MLQSTTTLNEAQNSVWDVIVVGAGPAGSVAALEIARRGLRVLLADRSTFPRHKLCGGCLNGDALATLRDLGLENALNQLHGEPLHQLSLRAGRRRLSLKLPSGLAVTRSRLDEMLIMAAIHAGASFLSGISLKLESAEPEDAVRVLSTQRGNTTERISARLVVVATGLPVGNATTDAGLAVVSTNNSRIGAGTTTSSFPPEYTAGTIYMAIGRNGYVGLTRTDNGTLNIAAALDSKAVRKAKPEGVVEDVLKEAGFPFTSEMLSGEWRGTVGLTRCRQVPAATRVLVVGDAGGYVEPFTGDGMAGAIRSGRAVVPFVERAVSVWNPQIIRDWKFEFQRLMKPGHRRCRILAGVLRYPTIVRGLIGIVSVMPSVGDAVIRQLNREDCHEMLNPRPGHSGAA
jgi:flavin-dependent dehydrogenase